MVLCRRNKSVVYAFSIVQGLGCCFDHWDVSYAMLLFPGVLSNPQAFARNVAVHTRAEDIYRACLWGSCWLSL